MWNRLESDENGDIKVDRGESFYVGDVIPKFDFILIKLISIFRLPDALNLR